jgi:hypothetical protein
VPIVIYLAGLAIKLGFAVDITLDIVNAFPRLHAASKDGIDRARANARSIKRFGLRVCYLNATTRFC